MDGDAEEAEEERLALPVDGLNNSLFVLFVEIRFKVVDLVTWWLLV